jgi:DNA-binding NarL/FixJ family response regulator
MNTYVEDPSAMTSDVLERTIDGSDESDASSRALSIARTENRPRLVIADDDPVVVMALVAQLKGAFEVVGTAGDGESAVQLVARERPDVALVDLEMPAGGGLHATCGIGEVSPETAVVILSIDEAAHTVLRLLKAGAMTYLRKGTPATELIERLQQSIAAHHSESGHGITHEAA